MKLLIIGHSVVDHIFDDENEKITPGGIYYSAIGFNSLIHDNDELHLLTSFSENDFHYFKKVFGQFDLKFANNIEKTPHVNLHLGGNAERREHYKSSFEPLKLSPEIDFNSFDGIYINMITGTDLTPEQFKQIRNITRAKIYLDVHTLSRGIGKDQHRFFRKIPNYDTYLSSVNIVQVNRHEFKTITPYDEKEKILETVFTHGIETIIITKGENGAELFSSDGTYHTVNAIKVESKNKVGCGDVFGSVFFYSYLSGLDIQKCFKKANRVAGIVTTYSTSNEFLKLKNDII